MNSILKNLITEISDHANTGRLQFEAEEEEDPLAAEEDPLAGDEEDPLAGGEEDPLAGGEEDPLAMGGEDPMAGGEEEDPAAEAEAAKAEAEASKAESEAEATEAEADAAKARADKEKSEAEREKAEAEAESFEGTEIFSRPGSVILMGLLLDEFEKNNATDSLAQTLVTKLVLKDTPESIGKFTSDSGAFLPLHGFQQLLWWAGLSPP